MKNKKKRKRKDKDQTYKMLIMQGALWSIACIT